MNTSNPILQDASNLVFVPYAIALEVPLYYSIISAPRNDPLLLPTLGNASIIQHDA
jgi:hypothetical protein